MIVVYSTTFNLTHEENAKENGCVPVINTVPFEPGSRVTHKHNMQSSGIVISIVDEKITILWSTPPNSQVDRILNLQNQIQTEIDRDIIADMVRLLK